MVTRVVTVLFTLVLVVAVPVLSFVTARRSELRLLPRRALYFSAVLSQWLLGALGLGVILVTSWSFADLGFRGISVEALLRWALVLASTSLGGLGVLLILERRGWWPSESELVHLLLPETREEKFWAVLVVAPTAALCEEFLYRGFLLAQLSQWFHSVPLGLAASSAVFALAHFYQGLNGMFRVALLGALLAYPVIELGSLYPSMLAHFLIDSLALAWLGPKFLGRPSPPWTG